MTKTLAALVVLSSACGGTSPTPATSASAQDDLSADPQGSAWQPSLPTGATEVTPGGSVTVAHCTFTVGTALEEPPFPPIYLVWVHKEAAHGHHCDNPGFVVVGSSFASPAVSIAGSHPARAVVVSFTFTATPSGEAHHQLEIVQPDVGSGAIVHETILAAASPDAFHPSLGNIFSGALLLDAHGDLEVSGTFDGVLPGATGTGTSYRATYVRFTSNPATNPTPDSIVAF